MGRIIRKVRAYQMGGPVEAGMEPQGASPEMEQAPQEPAGGGEEVVQQLQQLVAQYNQSKDPAVADQIVAIVAELLGMGAPADAENMPQGQPEQMQMARNGAKLDGGGPKKKSKMIYTGDTTGRTRGALVKKDKVEKSKSKPVKKFNPKDTFGENAEEQMKGRVGFKKGGSMNPYDMMMSKKKKNNIESYGEGNKVKEAAKKVAKKVGDVFTRKPKTKEHPNPGVKSTGPVAKTADDIWPLGLTYEQKARIENIPEDVIADAEASKIITASTNNNAYMGDPNAQGIYTSEDDTEDMTETEDMGGYGVISEGYEIDPETGDILPIPTVAQNIPSTVGYTSQEMDNTMLSLENEEEDDDVIDLETGLTGRQTKSIQQTYADVPTLFRAFRAAGLPENTIGYLDDGRAILYKYAEPFGYKPKKQVTPKNKKKEDKWEMSDERARIYAKNWDTMERRRKMIEELGPEKFYEYQQLNNDW